MHAIVRSFIKSLESNQRMNLRVSVFGQWPNFNLRGCSFLRQFLPRSLDYRTPSDSEGMLDSTCLPNRELEWPHPVAVAPGSGSSLQSFGLIDPSHHLSPIVQLP